MASRAPLARVAGGVAVKLVVVPAPYLVVRTVEKLTETARGAGGFGSTGAR